MLAGARLGEAHQRRTDAAPEVVRVDVDPGDLPHMVATMGIGIAGECAARRLHEPGIAAGIDLAPEAPKLGERCPLRLPELHNVRRDHA